MHVYSTGLDTRLLSHKHEIDRLQASPALQKANGNDGEFRKLFKHYDATALAYEALEMHKEASRNPASLVTI